METAPLEFFIADDAEAAKIISSLKCELGHVESQPERKVRRVYYDTFDWRLHQAGYTLACESAPGSGRSEVRKLGSGRLVLRAPESAARFAWENPVGPLREFLNKTIEIRALLPIVEMYSSLKTHSIRDKRGKAVLNIVQEIGTAALPDGNRDVEMKPRLRLEPVRGYSDTLRRAIAVLRKSKISEADRDILDEALSVVGRTIEKYQPKPTLPLSHDMPTIRAMSKILLHLRYVMEQNLHGTVEDLDSEFLHDFRVSVRRTRSALALIKGVFPGDLIRPFRDEFKWLGDITGPTRDLDVYLLKFPEYCRRLPETTRPDLEPFRDFVQCHQAREQKTLARHLQSPRLGKLLADWQEFLESSPEPEQLPPTAAMPIGDLARAKIWKTCRKFVREGEVIGADSPDQAIHELRITGKKLRYLLEFFQNLFPQKPMLQLVKAMKMMQDFLGDFQDLTVQQQQLHEFSEQMKQEKDVPAASLLAMGRLVEDMARQQQVMRLEFHDHFLAFNRGEHSRYFEKLFAPTKGDTS
jgi:CHAD domain-containing protein